MKDIIEEAQERIKKEHNVRVTLLPVYDISLAAIANAVCWYYDITYNQLAGRGRTHHPLQFARKAFCYIAQKYQYSSKHIAEFINRNRSVVNDNTRIATTWIGLYWWFENDVGQIIDIIWDNDSQ